MSHTVLAAPEVSSQPTWESVAAIVDHTLLKPEAPRAAVEKLCTEAANYRFACAFVHQVWAPTAVDILRGTGVKVGVPVGFPQGASFTTAKRFEALESLKIGAHDIDMVLNIGALKSGEHRVVEADIRGVAQIVHDFGGILKVILETSLLDLDEKIVACQLSVAAGADYVKTSTGFAGGGATVDDIALMRGVVGDKLGVKASGGVRTAQDAIAMIRAGASRLGTSAGVNIVRELGAPE
jgi:deoxyribose-phosphate aldolase